MKTCRHKTTGQIYAIKIAERQLSNKRLEAMLENEVTIWRSCHHPNIVSLHYVFETRHNYLLIMDIVRGGELFDKISTIDHYSESMAAGILLSILHGLQYLHANLIVHRDIKPENLLLSSADINETRVQIADFGIAARLSSPTALLQDIVGTPGYVAPEVLMLKHHNEPPHPGYGRAVDMWSVGVILYILLSGGPPFAHHDEDESFRRTLAGRYELPPEEWASISGAAKDLLAGLLSMDPATRLTADAALAHPWLSEPDRPHAVHLERSLTAIREKKFQPRTTFKAAATAIVAAQKLAGFASAASSSSSSSSSSIASHADLQFSLPTKLQLPAASEFVKLRYYLVDAFAEQPLSGNPAAVYPLQRWLTDQQMQCLAAEHRLPVTVFFVPRPSTSEQSADDIVTLSTRWFTPLRELSVCGHGALAAAHLWWQAIEQTQPSKTRQLIFESKKRREQLISVERVESKYRVSIASLQSFALESNTEEIRGLLSALALPAEIVPEIFVCSAPKLLVLLPTEQDVLQIAPNISSIEALPYSSVIVTAPGKTVDFVSRYFCPKNGFAEDVFTFSAHAILAPFWAGRLKKESLVAVQHSPNQSISIACRVHPDQASVFAEAHACIVGRGTLYLPKERR